MADHKAYMHPSFPSSQDNAHTPHLKHLHNVTHEDPNLAGYGGSGAGDGAKESINKGTI